MPVIACPGCGKQYKVADTVAGQVAKCACGKRFRLGSSPVAAAASAPTKSPAAVPTAPTKAVAASTQAKRAPVKAPASVSANDDFWDDALAIADAPKQAPTTATPATSTSTAKNLSGTAVPAAPKSNSTDQTKKKKRKKTGGVRWGFDWGKVVGGLGTFLIFGGITAAMAMTTGRISIYLAALAVVGLFTMLNGLMGEEGIW
jgi:hypothetical protein